MSYRRITENDLSDDKEKNIDNYLHKFDVYLFVLVRMFNLANVFSLFTRMMAPLSNVEGRLIMLGRKLRGARSGMMSLRVTMDDCWCHTPIFSCQFIALPSSFSYALTSPLYLVMPFTFYQLKLIFMISSG